MMVLTCQWEKTGKGVEYVRLRDVVADTTVRTQQLDAFARLDSVMKIGEAAPSDRAAEIVLSLVGRA